MQLNPISKYLKISILLQRFGMAQLMMKWMSYFQPFSEKSHKNNVYVDLNVELAGWFHFLV